MRTVSFKSVCDLALQRYGADPDVETTPSILLALGSAIDDAVTDAWQWTDWPELTDVAQVTPEAGGVIGVTGNIFRVYAIYTMDPRVKPDAPTVDFVDLGDRVQMVGTCLPASVWVKYWLPPSKFTRSSWNEATQYVADDVRYLDTAGNCYLALKASLGVMPGSDADVAGGYWKLQAFPAVLKNNAALNGAAMLLEDDGQYDKGNSKKADALDALLLEQDHFRSRTRAVR